MDLNIKNEYPKYLYHKNEDEPMLVTNKEMENKALRQGWSNAYIPKEYPKWVNTKDGTFLVHTEDQHRTLLALDEDETNEDETNEDETNEDETNEDETNEDMDIN